MASKRIAYILVALTVLTLVSAALPMPMGGTIECSGVSVYPESGYRMGTWTQLPSGRWEVRGDVLEVDSTDTSGNPICSSIHTVTLNANLDADLYGLRWGTIHTVYSDGSVCDGTWTGKWTETEHYADAVETRCEGGNIQAAWQYQTTFTWTARIMLAR